MEQLLYFLEGIYPLSEQLKLHLLKILKVTHIEKKEYLLKAGHISTRVYFIANGLLRCFYIKEDVDVSSWFMKEGDVIFSVESFINQKPSNENIQALEDATLLYIDYDELQSIYRQFPEFNFIGRVLTEKYYVLSEQRSYSLRMQRAQERYDYLLDFHSELILRVPGKYLASYLGITEVTLSKIKGKR